MITYEHIILLSWAAFLIFWVISAFYVKRDIRGDSAGLWWQYWWLRVAAALLLIFVAMRLVAGSAHDTTPHSIFSQGILWSLSWLQWLGAACALLGVSLAIWARVHLGRNWSPRPAVKENHELITTGPYAYVRHPIYTGVIVMAFGTALTGSIFGLGIFLFASLIFIARIGKEEKIMHKLFPREYPAYQQRTTRLIPFVW